MYRYPRPFSAPFSAPMPYPHVWHPYHPYSYASMLPTHWPGVHQGHPAATSYPTPYPKPRPVLTGPAPGIQSLMAQFKNSDGTYDINKMMNTMGQMINTVNQVNGMLKGLISAFKK
ncbi:YppG family protein [Saccharococcus caldoxylosilyticus]|jgi:hypothetical protein|uniref:Spore coat protein n=2 Tax=Saccharococcus caldoxylosilyticus TaxID=81408 RepID=A0A023DFW9_9BACL|nr:YppG family protein [Parageobacillus caldoxylosilyticus]KYD04058.1 hypothetical protein B4119_2461 [Parageobacillus caldoxylosilyticus]MBB3853413.1 hypothetical protein [Parageobacillus caldoxylosilyticus]QXJ39886.1 hypothetical protein BV455_03252 [Parageobacillus caldoxylosilyticus]BDG36512.1 hypothetical protein PcaKH15_24180 [Parageobacillus caldoxylosilyticus]BDG40300.1 hypothetical protein PcaKH16_24390 [Parageobacillus caldoxylosilyticus]